MIRVRKKIVRGSDLNDLRRIRIVEGNQVADYFLRFYNPVVSKLVKGVRVNPDRYSDITIVHPSQTDWIPSRINILVDHSFRTTYFTDTSEALVSFENGIYIVNLCDNSRWPSFIERICRNAINLENSLGTFHSTVTSAEHRHNVNRTKCNLIY